MAARPDAAPHIRAVSVDTTASTPCLVTARARRWRCAPNTPTIRTRCSSWKDHTAQRESEEITALCASSEINYARHSGNHYSAECFWAKCLAPAARQPAGSAATHMPWSSSATGYPPCSPERTIPPRYASHCAAGSKQMWAEAWGGFPPETFSKHSTPHCYPSCATSARRTARATTLPGRSRPRGRRRSDFPRG